jgi:hypothetical protein
MMTPSAVDARNGSRDRMDAGRDGVYSHLPVLQVGDEVCSFYMSHLFCCIKTKKNDVIACMIVFKISTGT